MLIMTELVTSITQVESNAIRLSIEVENGVDQKKAKSLIANGRNFYTQLHEGKWIFAPSRYVGYVGNNIPKHSEAVTLKQRDGLLTDKRLDQTAVHVERESSLHSALEDQFAYYCSKNKISPSKHPKKRIFWVNSHDLNFISSTQVQDWDKHIKRMAESVNKTVGASGGQRMQVIKSKSTNMTTSQLEELMSVLIKKQNYKCALTGLKLSNGEDGQLVPSPDRIDSNGHYTEGNIQIVCKFANFWKNNQENAEFLRLLKLVRS